MHKILKNSPLVCPLVIRPPWLAHWSQDPLACTLVTKYPWLAHWSYDTPGLHPGHMTPLACTLVIWHPWQVLWSYGAPGLPPGHKTPLACPLVIWHPWLAPLVIGRNPWLAPWSQDTPSWSPGHRKNTLYLTLGNRISHSYLMGRVHSTLPPFPLPPFLCPPFLCPWSYLSSAARFQLVRTCTCNFFHIEGARRQIYITNYTLQCCFFKYTITVHHYNWRILLILKLFCLVPQQGLKGGIM